MIELCPETPESQHSLLTKVEWTIKNFLKCTMGSQMWTNNEAFPNFHSCESPNIFMSEPPTTRPPAGSFVHHLGGLGHRFTKDVKNTVEKVSPPVSRSVEASKGMGTW